MLSVGSLNYFFNNEITAAMAFMSGYGQQEARANTPQRSEDVRPSLLLLVKAAIKTPPHCGGVFSFMQPVLT